MSDDRRRVVVLGGTGFLGGHIVRELLRGGARVTVLARTEAVVEGAAFEPLSIDATTEAETLATLRRLQPNTVVNAMGSIWGTSPADAWESVAVPSLTVLRAVQQLDPAPRYVHLGSVLELGKVIPGSLVEASTRPHSPGPYGAAKLAVTSQVLDAFERRALTGLVLRVSNVAGPGSPAGSLLGRVARATAHPTSKPPVIELDPLIARRDYVDVRDVARAVALAVRSTASGALIDIGRGEAVEVRSLVDMMIELSGSQAVVHEHHGARSHSGETWTCVNPEPARQLIGWTPTRPLRDSLRDHLDHVRASLTGADQ